MPVPQRVDFLGEPASCPFKRLIDKGATSQLNPKSPISNRFAGVM
ncbi:hypothetical protein [Microcoleus sp.]